jgi:thioredoxin-related protein
MGPRRLALNSARALSSICRPDCTPTSKSRTLVASWQSHFIANGFPLELDCSFIEKVEMSSGKYLCALFFCMSALWLWTGCSEKSTATKNEVGDIPRAGSFSWVSSAVIFDTSSQKKPVSMLIVSTSWCHWCDSLHHYTLRDSTVMGMIDSWFNACIIDADSDSLIIVGDSLISCYDASRDVFSVKGYPTTIFFNCDASKSVSCPGYLRAGAYADLLYRAYDSLKAK